MGVEHPRPALGLGCRFRERYRLDGELLERDHVGHARLDRLCRIGLRVLAPHEEIRGSIEQAVIDPRDAVLLEIAFPGHDIESHADRLEEGSHLVEVFLGDWIVFVVVALGAVHRQAQQPLADVLHRLVHPRRAVEEEPVAGEKTGGAELRRIIGIELVGREHLADHLIVGQVGVDRFDDPVAVVPHVLLAVAKLVTQSPPVAVPPDVHPVASPPLAVPRIGEQLLDERFIPVGRRIGLERGQFLRLRRQADEIERDPANQNSTRRLGLRHDARLLVGLGEKGVNRVSHPRRVLHGGYLRPHPRLKRPVALWIGLGLFIRRRGAAGLDPVPDHRELLGRQRLPLALGRHPRGRI